VTDPVGTVIDIDGEKFRIGWQTDQFDFPLHTFDYTRLSPPIKEDARQPKHSNGARPDTQHTSFKNEKVKHRASTTERT